MNVLNCTILIDNPQKDKLIGILKEVVFIDYQRYSPKIFIVLEEIQEGISNVSIQFFLGDTQSYQSFEENQFVDFIEKVSTQLQSPVQCFLTHLKQF